MAKTNATKQGDPDPLLSELAKLRTMVRGLGKRVKRMAGTVKEIKESLKASEDIEDRIGKEDRP